MKKKIIYNKYNLILIFIFFSILNEYKVYKKINLLFNNFENRYNFIIQNLPFYNHTHIHNNTIYWCWLQENISFPILNACLNSIIKNKKGNRIVIINQNNINQYVHFPYFILQKYQNNLITKTHFSDLLRLELLIKYGGTWVDATVLMTKYDERFFNKDLFLFQSMGQRNKKFSSWFLTSEKESPILKTTRDLLYEYWRIKNQLNNYFLLHFFMNLAFNKYRDDLNKIFKYSRDIAHLMQRYLFKPFNNKIYNQITNKISIHKLTYKFNHTNIKKGLFYQYILKLYG